ncbi:DNRLRE domain-containing protein [Streptomyces sp. NPDC051940]|uniref:DNRLRE domain-containing protein n=1 Tax=Streptomyces sp. NPDC051940 TaxID=3155675 RepID=UPI003433362F
MGSLHRWSARVVVLSLLVTALPAAAATLATADEQKRTVHVLPKGNGGWEPTDAPDAGAVAWKPPKGRGGGHLVKPDPRANRLGELTKRRTAHSSFYRMSDGSVREVVSAAPVHYRDAKGVWRDIDPAVRKLRHDGFTAGSTANSVRTYFSADAARLVRLEQGTGSIQLGLDGASASAPEVSGNRVSYPGAYPGADVTYETGPTGLKESIVLRKAPPAGQSYSATLKVKGYTPRQLDSGAIEFYRGEAAEPAFTIPAPYMSDAKDDPDSPYGKVSSADVRQTMDWDARKGVLRLKITPDAAWLADPKRRYPVTVDPTIVVAPTPSQAANVMILADGPTTNYATSWRLSVGTTTTGAARTLIRFPMPSVPAGTTIASANLKLYYDQTFTTGSKTVAMQALAANTSWNPANATWDSAKSITGPVAGTSSKAANALGVWNTFPVTSTVQSWVNGTTANNGFVLKAAAEGTLGQGGPRYEASTYAYGGETVNYPKLEISYGVPGVTVDRPSVIRSTGAQLSWPAYTNSTGDTANDLAEYQVHRSVYQTFAPSSATRIAPVASGTTAFSDSTAVPTPADDPDPYGNAYYYMVVVKTKSGGLIPGPTTLVRLPKAGRTTVILPARSATTLSSLQPNAVLNTLPDNGAPQPWLEVGNDSGTYGVTRSVLDFPALPAVSAGARVLEAHLKLWQETTLTASSGAVYELHGLKRSFTGSQATWNSAATGTAWSAPGGDFDPLAGGTVSGLTNDPSRQTLDATSIVQGWMDTPETAKGLLVKLAGETTASPREHTVFAGPNTAERALAPALVVTYLDRTTAATYYAPETPQSMAPGTSYTVPVTVNNTTGTTWKAADKVLTYHWQLPDGTDATTPASQLQTALPADLPPAGTVTLDAKVTPPDPGDGNQRSGYTIAWDVYDKTTGVYLSEDTGGTAPMLGVAPQDTGTAATATATATTGIGSLKQQTGVAASGNNQLGLEQFYPYTTMPTGSGSSLYSNTATGNTVWNNDLFSNPSVGFNTFLRLNYNSLDTTDTTTGFGWSLQASAPVRLGSSLRFHPPSNPTAVVMDDGTGNGHQWNLDTSTSPATWKSPPGIHLFLRKLADCAPKTTNDRAWSMTKPDRTVFYFDCDGNPTAQVDANGNQADYVYAYRQSENKPKAFLQYITDPLHIQTLTLTYYNKGEDYQYVDSAGALANGTDLTNPAIIDHVKSITDVGGRTINFYYTTQGLMARYVDGAGTPEAKTFQFTYDATQGMKNVKLVAVKDPRGHTTRVVYYEPWSPTKWWTHSITDRLGKETHFAYVQPGVEGGPTTETTVTNSNGNDYVYQSDAKGRMTQAVNPKSEKTTLTWDGDNNVASLTEANGARSEWTYDQRTGYPLSYKDAEAVKNGTAATVYTYRTDNTADPVLSGRIADLTDKTSPEGRRWHYTHDAAGNLLTETDPNGTAAGAEPGSYTSTYTYNPHGQVTSRRDANGNNTSYGYTNFVGPGIEVPESTGKPVTVVDALLKSSRFEYGPRGEVTEFTNPLGRSVTATYDVFLRSTGSSTPKDVTTDTYVIEPAPVYDANDNVVKQQSPYLTGYPDERAVSTAVYDAGDRPTSLTGPPNTDPTVTAPPRTVTYTYDNLGNQLTMTRAKGNLPGAEAGSYTTATHYDSANQPDSTTDALGNKALIGYDNVGNRTSVTDPRGNVTKIAYDQNHRPTGATDAAGKNTSVRYDLDGLKTSTTDRNGNSVEYSSNPRGQVVQIRVPTYRDEGGIHYNTTQYVYDQVGNNTKVVTPRGVASGVQDAYTTATVYDALNRPAKKLGAYLPGDGVYGENQRPETEYTYDAASRLTGITRITQPNPDTVFRTPERAVTALTYYDNGWTKTSADPYKITTEYDYNGRGQQTSREVTSSDGAMDNATGAANRSMYWLYHPDGSLRNYHDSGLPKGWQSSIITADSQQTENTSLFWDRVGSGGYDGAGYYKAAASQAVFTWNLSVPQDGDYTVYVHYPNVADAGPGAAYKTTYDGGTKTSDPVFVNQTENRGTWVPIGKWAFKAGTSGQKVQLSPSGVNVVADAVRIVRDHSGETTPPGRDFTYDYDANGNLTKVTDGSPDATYDNYTSAYDEIDRVSQLLERTGETAKHTTGYGYDEASNLTRQTHDSTSADYSYNGLNQLTKIVNKQFAAEAGRTTTLTYTPTGQRATLTKGNGNVVTNDYNFDGTLASARENTGGGALVASHNLSYDSNSNVIVDDTDLRSADDGSTKSRAATREYTPNDQIAKVTNTDGKTNQSYLYDSAGNIRAQTVDEATVHFQYDRGRLVSGWVPSLATSSYQYDTMGRLNTVANGFISGHTEGVSESYTYDGYDNVTDQSRTGQDGTNRSSYTYDSLNRKLTEAINPGGTSTQSASYEYLGTSKTLAGEQIEKPSVSITKSYEYAPGGERLAMLDSTFTNTNVIDRTSHYSYNPHSDVEALTGDDGNAVATYGYTAYGAPDKTFESGLDKDSSGSASFPFNSFRFNSARVSTATDNLDMGFRTYNPNINRFISQDMYNGAGADLAMAANPYTGNRYAFAGGNPISNIEQDGHSWKNFVAGLVGGLVGYGLCTLATAGTGLVICAGIVGGILGGLASQGVTCAEGGDCSAGAFGKSAAIGGIAGLVSAGVGLGISGLLPQAMSPVLAGAISGVGAGAAGGATDYGLRCATGDACSWGGFATATAAGAVIGGGLGAVAGKFGAFQRGPGNQQHIDRITGLLRARTQQAADDFDSNTAALTPGEMRQKANPRTAAAARGNYIDRVVKEYAANDPYLSTVVYRAENFEHAPDFWNVDLRTWWDMTTPEQWAQHLNDYEYVFGEGIPLFTR